MDAHRRGVKVRVITDDDQVIVLLDRLKWPRLIGENSRTWWWSDCTRYRYVGYDDGLRQSKCQILNIRGCTDQDLTRRVIVRRAGMLVGLLNRSGWPG